MIDRRITDFIARHHVLTLSTVADGMPHGCNLFYAYDPQRNLFAVTSSDETLHARQARQNPRIAASVVLETRVVGKVQGLQIRGTMMPAEAETLPSVRKVYLGRFPYAAAVKLELWTIRPDFMKLTDNRLGFGKKTYRNGKNFRHLRLAEPEIFEFFLRHDADYRVHGD